MDDSCTPLIPITAIEDEDGTDQLDAVMPPPMQLGNLSNAGIPQNSTFEQLNSQQKVVNSVPNLPRSTQPTSGPPSSAEPDVLAAASAAFTAIMRSSEEGSLIDRDLLIKILSNPVMVEKLVSEYGAPKQTQSPPVVNSVALPSHQPQVNASAPASRQPAVIPAAAPPRQPVVTAPAASAPGPPPQTPLSTPFSAPPPSHMFRTANTAPSPALHSHHVPAMLHHPRPLPVPPPLQASAPPVKDANYYKSLIQLHGGDKAEALDQNPVQFGNLSRPLDYHNNMPSMTNVGDPIGVVGMNQRDPKPKVLKPCAYFNTPRGCRHGASCLFQHDASSIPQRIEQQKGATKRIKLDGGIAGRN